MVKSTEQHPALQDAETHLDDWLCHIAKLTQINDITPLKKACALSCEIGKNQPATNHSCCFYQGLEMADILAALQVDIDTLCAAVLSSCVQHTKLPHDVLQKHVSAQTLKLVQGTSNMHILDTIHPENSKQGKDEGQINQLRKMMLAMLDDARAILIKLAERVSIMRAIKGEDKRTKQQIAQKTLDIYAPLASRLGIIHIKWELEDLAFAYLKPDTYKNIASLLSERRLDREKGIFDFKTTIKQKLDKAHIKAEIMGRAKHIYSIHRKMQRKNIAYHEIYDASAIRILVDKIEDCYAALGIIHSTWDYISSEFDDYIAHPKPNGYQSIHTVIEREKHRLLEIQIRTHAMHEESEFGFAAHWKYKEGHTEKSSYEEKIARLRQLLDWHKDIAHGETPLEHFHDTVFEDQIYVFTPAGDIINLPKGSTPLDFAYHIHSEIGHRCRGAKINHKMVPLTYKLGTGEQVSILTTREARPSRDWINPEQGYLTTPRARSHVQHWFKQEHYDEHIIVGKNLLEKELLKLNIRDVNFEKLAHEFAVKTPENLFAALSSGNVRIGQVLSLLQRASQETKKKPSDNLESAQHKTRKEKSFPIRGIDNLLTHIAACCKPIPGDKVLGYITKGHGVSIHRQDCLNVINTHETDKDRIMEVTWGEQKEQLYYTDIYIEANDRPNFVNDITSILANQHVNISTLTKRTKSNKQKASVFLTLETKDAETLIQTLEKIKQLPNVIFAERNLSGIQDTSHGDKND